MTQSAKTQRYGKRTQIRDRMKLHLRLVKVRGTTLRVVSLRPRTRVAFSTNYFHDTWHILSDARGARLLARLIWGLSFQRQPGTLILIHGEHIKPTPFGAERSDPIVLLPPDLTKNDEDTLGQLHRRIHRLGPSQGTLRWHTFGLDQALQRQKAEQSRDWSQESSDPLFSWQQNQPLWKAEQMFRRAGFVCYSAPPQIMRRQAVIVSQMQPGHYGMDYHYLAESNRAYWPDGEVQIFSDYHARRSAAAQARKQVLRQADLPLDPLQLYETVAVRRDQILRRLNAAKRT